MGCTDPLKRGVGAPHQCPLGSVASYLQLIYTDVRSILMVFMLTVQRYTHVLKGAKYGGMTVLDWITASHASGAATAQSYVGRWSSVAASADCSSTGVVEGCGAITKLLQGGATDAATFAQVVSSFVTATAGGNPVPPPPAPPSPSPSPPSPPSPGPSPAGFALHKDSYCSVGANHNDRIFENKTMGLDACAAGCSKSAACACFDLDSKSMQDCRWTTTEFNLKGSGDRVAYVKY